MAGIIFLLFLDGGFSERQIFRAAIALWAMFVIIDFLSPPIPPQQWRGWLQPSNEPTPANGCDGRIPAGRSILLAGSNGVTLPDPIGHIRVIAIGKCDTLIFDRSESGIKVTAPLFDDAGNPMGEIIDNGYTIEKDEGVVVEHSGDLSTLVVNNSIQDGVAPCSLSELQHN